MEEHFKDRFQSFGEEQLEFDDLTGDLTLTLEDNNSQNSLAGINFFKLFKRCFINLENQLDELGLWSFKNSLRSSIEVARKILVAQNTNAGGDLNKKLVEFIRKMIGCLEELLSRVETDLPAADEHKILEFSSVKVRTLVDYLDKLAKETHEHNRFVKKKLHGILFVERKSTAACLNFLFTRLAETNNDRLYSLKTDFIHGDSSFKSGSDMNSKKQVQLSSARLFFFKKQLIYLIWFKKGKRIGEISTLRDESTHRDKHSRGGNRHTGMQSSHSIQSG